MNGMIQATNENIQVLTTNTSDVKFSDVTLRTQSANCQNGWLGYNQGEAQFNIVAGGIYEINFNANITSATTGIVSLGLFANGNQLIGTEMNEEITTANNWKNISMNRKIRVCARGNATLVIKSITSVIVNGVSTATQIPNIKNANISIERLA